MECISGVQWASEPSTTPPDLLPPPTPSTQPSAAPPPSPAPTALNAAPPTTTPYWIGLEGESVRLQLAMEGQLSTLNGSQLSDVHSSFRDALRRELRLAEDGLDVDVLQVSAQFFLATFEIFDAQARVLAQGERGRLNLTRRSPLVAAIDLACQLSRLNHSQHADESNASLASSLRMYVPLEAVLYRVLVGGALQALGCNRPSMWVPPPPGRPPLLPLDMTDALTNALSGVIAESGGMSTSMLVVVSMGSLLLCCCCLLYALAARAARGLLGPRLQLMVTHSNPAVKWHYLPREQRAALRTRNHKTMHKTRKSVGTYSQQRHLMVTLQKAPI